MTTTTQKLTLLAQIQLPALSDVETNWRKVESSFISHVAWVHTGNRHGVVLVAINNNGKGGLYAYFNVPSWTYAAWFMPGTSIGRYYVKVFKGSVGAVALWRWGQPAKQARTYVTERVGARARRMMEDGRKLGLHNRRAA